MIRFSNIPRGDTNEDRAARKRIISAFFNEWYAKNPSKKVFNSDLKEYIYIKQVSFEEAYGHSSLKYESTLALLQMDTVLRAAVRVGNPGPPKPGVENQKKFIKIQEMRCVLNGIGEVKLTVGIKKNKEKVQYCITAVNVT